jgi:hypothetical protein
MGDCITDLLQIAEGGWPIGVAPGRPPGQLQMGRLRAAMAGAGGTAIEQEWLNGPGKACQAGWICRRVGQIIGCSGRYRQREAQQAGKAGDE